MGLATMVSIEMVAIGKVSIGKVSTERDSTRTDMTEGAMTPPAGQVPRIAQTRDGRRHRAVDSQRATPNAVEVQTVAELGPRLDSRCKYGTRLAWTCG